MYVGVDHQKQEKKGAPRRGAPGEINIPETCWSRGKIPPCQYTMALKHGRRGDPAAFRSEETRVRVPDKSLTFLHFFFLLPPLLSLSSVFFFLFGFLLSLWFSSFSLVFFDGESEGWVAGVLHLMLGLDPRDGRARPRPSPPALRSPLRSAPPALRSPPALLWALWAPKAQKNALPFFVKEGGAAWPRCRQGREGVG